MPRWGHYGVTAQPDLYELRPQLLSIVKPNTQPQTFNRYLIRQFVMAERLLKKECLPAGTPRCQYHGKMQCLRTIEDVSHTQHSYIILDGVDSRTFYRNFRKGRLGHLVKSCLLPDGIIVLNITMETLVHAAAQAEFMSMIHNWYRNQTEVLTQSTGNLLWRNPHGKKPDGAWMPDSTETYWPSVVVEIGWTEGPKKLRKDIEFWLAGGTKAAISLNITATGRMTLDAWRKNEKGKVESYQKLHINARGSVTGDFSIPFNAFYLREKLETETDLKVTHQMFSDLAKRVQVAIASQQAAKAAERAAADNIQTFCPRCLFPEKRGRSGFAHSVDSSLDIL